ncbi:MAG TPA: hypothetical protein VE994_03685 [Terriglobales bacterium]|nr:hypothetical protein [Terriglobales bacterium]
MAKALLLDHQFGPATMWFTGTLADKKLALRMTRCRSKAPLQPLDGKVTASLDEKSQHIEGTWETDIGTSGSCRFDSSHSSWPRWILWLIGAKLRPSRWFAFLYMAFLFVCAIGSMTSSIHLSSFAVILLLLPAPFLFTSDIARLITAFRQAGVKRAGPFEFEQNLPTMEIVAPATQQDQENIAFAQLNRFFVLRTKILLMVLDKANGMSLAEFRNLAPSLGVAEDNVVITLQAIVQTGCAEIHDDKVVLTSWGKRYVEAGLKLP